MRQQDWCQHEEPKKLICLNKTNKNGALSLCFTIVVRGPIKKTPPPFQTHTHKLWAWTPKGEWGFEREWPLQRLSDKPKKLCFSF